MSNAGILRGVKFILKPQTNSGDLLEEKMKYIRNFLILTFAFLTFFTFDAKAQTPQNALEKKIFKEIITLPRYGVFDHISYKLDGNTVTLYGKTYSLGTKKAAERVVNNHRLERRWHQVTG